MKRVLPFAFGVLLGLAVVSAQAQTNSSRHYDLGVSTGPFLPSHVWGVEEIIPFTAFAFSHPLYSFRPEYMLLSGRSENVIYYIASINIRNDIYFVPGMYWSLGYEHHQYTRYFHATRYALPGWNTNNGINMSFGFFIPNNTPIQFRTLVRLGTQEGRSVYVGLGLTFALGPMSGSPTTN